MDEIDKKVMGTVKDQTTPLAKNKVSTPINQPLPKDLNGDREERYDDVGANVRKYIAVPQKTDSRFPGITLRGDFDGQKQDGEGDEPKVHG